MDAKLLDNIMIYRDKIYAVITSTDTPRKVQGLRYWLQWGDDGHAVAQDPPLSYYELQALYELIGQVLKYDADEDKNSDSFLKDDTARLEIFENSIIRCNEPKPCEIGYSVRAQEIDYSELTGADMQAMRSAFDLAVLGKAQNAKLPPHRHVEDMEARPATSTTE